MPVDGMVSLKGRSESGDQNWQRHYNEVWPHSSLGNLTPMAFRSMGGKTAMTEAILKE
jgi:putative transposase